MSDKPETVTSRIWRDRAKIREQEHDEARARLRIAEEKVAILLAENNRLAAESIRLRMLFNPGAGRNRSETERQMAELRGALMPLLDRMPRTQQ